MTTLRRSTAAPPRPSQPLHAAAAAAIAAPHADPGGCRPYRREGSPGQPAPSWEDLLGRR